METKLSQAMGAILSLLLVLVGFWAWDLADRVAAASNQPALAGVAVRCGAAAALLGAQALALTFVANALLKKTRGGEVLRLGLGLLCTAALMISLSLAIASK